MKSTFPSEYLLIDILFPKELPNMIKMYKLQIWTDFQSTLPYIITTFDCPISISLISLKGLLLHLLLALNVLNINRGTRKKQCQLCAQ